MRAILSAFFPGMGVLLALVLMAPAPAHAGPGVNLSWSRCWGEGVGAQNRTFACDTNDGTEVLVTSFVLPGDLAHVSGNEVNINLISEDDPLPAWWDFKNPGSCRLSSLVFNTIEDPGNVVCVDWAAGHSYGGIGAYDMSGISGIGSGGSIDPSLMMRHRKIKIALAVPPDSLENLVAGTEYFSCNLVIDHAKTVGTGACSGCAGSVCLVVEHINITTPILANNLFLFGGTTPGSDMARWQGSGADCNLVPVKDKTWGQVKAMYR